MLLPPCPVHHVFLFVRWSHGGEQDIRQLIFRNGSIIFREQPLVPRKRTCANGFDLRETQAARADLMSFPVFFLFPHNTYSSRFKAENSQASETVVSKDGTNNMERIPSQLGRSCQRSCILVPVGGRRKVLCVQRQTSWTGKTTSAIYLYSILFDRDRHRVSGVFGMWLRGKKVH